MKRIETCTPLKTAFEVAYSFVLDPDMPRHVIINKDEMDVVAEDVKDFLANKGDKKLWGVPKIVHEKRGCCSNLNPSWLNENLAMTFNFVMYELIACSVNYCYWYGADNIRPNDSRSSTMYSLLDESMEEAGLENSGLFKTNKAIYLFGKKMSEHRLPMMKERLAHLEEIMNPIRHAHWFYDDEERGLAFESFSHGEIFAIQLSKQLVDPDVTPDLRFWMDKLLHWFPGLAEDIFIKRASLFFMMLNRRMGFFQEDLGYLPIPADYQIPKVLRCLDVLNYNEELANKIHKSELISEGSLMECQIRGATITVAENIARIANCTATDVDDYLWGLKDKVHGKFHLTRTTNY